MMRKALDEEGTTMNAPMRRAPDEEGTAMNAGHDEEGTNRGGCSP